MEKTYIRDQAGRLRGSIEIDSRGIKIARDRTGRFLGTYDPRQNVTKNTAGKVIGRGDTVVSLIP